MQASKNHVGAGNKMVIHRCQRFFDNPIAFAYVYSYTGININEGKIL